MFGRMPGRDGGYLPGGPYTLTQGVLFMILLVIVWKLPLLDWLGPARWGVPLAALLVRRARIESRTPLGWLYGLVTHLLAPAAGTHRGKPYRPDRPLWIQSRMYLHATDEQVAERAVAEPCTASPVVSSLQLLLARARTEHRGAA
ncbi:hypothetical protein GCM10023192_56160 [Amycolatopsis samaneae]